MLPITLRTLINAKFSLQRFWTCHEKKLFNKISTIPHNCLLLITLNEEGGYSWKTSHTGCGVSLEPSQWARSLAHWIYQNLMLMSWPEATEHTNVFLVTQGFRNDLSFLSRTQSFFYLYGAHDIACKWQFHWSEKNVGSGQKRKFISESLGQKENVGMLRCFRSWH